MVRSSRVSWRRAALNCRQFSDLWMNGDCRLSLATLLCCPAPRSKSMLCHICKEDAVGQCKTCGKFYCPQHGDVICQSCSSAVQTQEPKPPVQPAPASLGHVCYKCGTPAIFHCSCGRLCCPE